MQQKNTKSPNSINSSEIVASNDDLLTEILLLLPIKPLMRFKSVSKMWLSLITNHTFCIRRNPFPNPPIGLCLSIKYRNQYSYQYISLYPDLNPNNSPPIILNFTTDPSKTEIIHSCNGLLLCCSSKMWDGDRFIIHQHDCSIYVYNPTTNSSVTLLDSTTTGWYPHGATLVFDPVKSPHYKVVLLMFVFLKSTRICEIKVYSSETGRWSECVVELDERWVADVCGGGVYWNGSVHWLSSELSVQRPTKSLRFNVDTCVIEDMPSPPVLRDHSWSSYYYFWESCDHLYFVENLLPKLKIYEMKRDYSEWFVKYQVDITRLADAFPEMIRVSFLLHVSYVGYVLSLIRGEDDKELTLVLRIPGKVVKFNLVDGTSENLRDCVHDRIEHKISFLGGVPVETYEFQDEYAFDYIQSLYSC